MITGCYFEREPTLWWLAHVHDWGSVTKRLQLSPEEACWHSETGFSFLHYLIICHIADPQMPIKVLSQTIIVYPSATSILPIYFDVKDSDRSDGVTLESSTSLTYSEYYEQINLSVYFHSCTLRDIAIINTLLQQARILTITQETIDKLQNIWKDSEALKISNNSWKITQLVLGVWFTDQNEKDEYSNMIFLRACIEKCPKLFTCYNFRNFLLQDFEEELRYRDDKCRSILEVAIEMKISWSDGLKDIHEKQPQAALTRNLRTHFYPFQTLGVLSDNSSSSLDGIYELFNASVSQFTIYLSQS